jgi:glycosyltransferase involved in cell wall biosynthesis
MAKENSDVTVVIPAKNEARTLPGLLSELRGKFPEFRILVVDDGSTDTTAAICKEHEVDVVSLPYSVGNGGAVKAGVRNVETDTLVLMDADGQHAPEDIFRLLGRLEEGYEMVVGARGWKTQANFGRAVANTIYNRLAEWMVGQKVPDLTSGFRAVRTAKFKEFLYLLPNGFSYPTTITMAFFRAGFSVSYVPIEAGQRTTASHINPLRDGIRFLLIIFRVGTLYSPLKIFFPLSLAFFGLGFGYFMYTILFLGRFTNMGALVLITSVLVFLIGLVSEQITNLLFSRRHDNY